MNITNLRTQNWKGRDLDIALSPVTVITGDNFAGKTSVPMALRFALTGYLPPPIGKRNEAIFALAGDQNKPMSVVVETDTGRKSSLTLSKTAKGKVTLEGGVPADLVLPGLLVEPTTFFGMTSAERVQAVFAACDVSGLGLTADELCKRVAMIEAMPAKYAEQAKLNMVSRVHALWAFDIPGSLSRIENEWKDDLKAAKDSLTRKQAELSATSAITREAPAFDHARYIELSKQLAAFTKELQMPEQIQTAIQDNRIILNQLEEAITAVDVAQRELDDLDELDACPRCKASAKGWKHEVETALKKDLENARHTRDSLNKRFIESKIAVEAMLAAEEVRKGGVNISIEAVKADMAKLEADRAARETWQRSIGKRDALEADVIGLTAEVECYHKGRKIVTELREQAVAQTFGKVLEVARNFTDGLLNSPIEMVDGALGRRVSEVDREQGNTAPVGAWIPHEAFSGTEQLLAYAGFAVALAGQAPIKLVIMDELGRLTLGRKEEMLARMVSLVKRGIIDQFIGCDVEAVSVTGVYGVVLGQPVEL